MCCRFRTLSTVSEWLDDPERQVLERDWQLAAFVAGNYDGSCAPS